MALKLARYAERSGLLGIFFLVWVTAGDAQVKALNNKDSERPKFNYNIGISQGYGGSAKPFDSGTFIVGFSVMSEISMNKNRLIVGFSDYTSGILSIFNTRFYNYKVASLSYGYGLGSQQFQIVPHLGFGHLSKKFDCEDDGCRRNNSRTSPYANSHLYNTYLSTIIGLALHWQPKRWGVGLILQQNFNQFNNLSYAEVSVRFRVNKLAAPLQ